MSLPWCARITVCLARTCSNIVIRQVHVATLLQADAPRWHTVTLATRADIGFKGNTAGGDAPQRILEAQELLMCCSEEISERRVEKRSQLRGAPR